MLSVFGWEEPHPDKETVRAPWAEAQAATERSVAPMFEALDPAERAEFVDLVNALQTSLA